ncbi:sigma-54-dependent Fis family transcriptional regulator [Natronincola ferrireducens]|uniref:Transcriptional regulator containing PAS, AAA-type ATPase, and DNA-binding Fis domains n=1 Tax=Natronincola ferrireducens TaxID=393762 RepID=A0A1G9HK25_9FIRM|nr:sigma 54-interacting transcriptional regulator [Natronincola ferrireducens]SDL13279.1 Transcriptional regulator containing PAS, AAA-type ATPase, and DNA-binding Fis domains [Natronincola ferrireducens]
MGFDLSSIQGTVQKYAEVIAQVSGVDVEVVDKKLYRVAGTGLYAGDINQDMSSEGYVYKHLLNTGETMIIYNPGEDSLCSNCPNSSNCQETIEISMPIKVHEEIIGIIGLVGSSKEQRDLILQNEKLYLEFVNQIADFIAAKALEQKEKESNLSIIATLDSVIDYMEQGVLIMGEGNIITKSNENAKKQLGVSTVEGKTVEIIYTGDELNNTSEYKMIIDNKEVFIMGEVYPLGLRNNQYTSILIFKNIKTIHSDLYEMTATHKTIDAKNIIGSSEATKRLKSNIEKVACSNSTVLITGESGTGKEMVATAIWRESDRRTQKFVAVNCAAIPESLLESELFGYVKGAFSGADPKGRIGKFELANQGIIFLDEIGDMPIYLQAKLLRILQERTITRIGSNQVIPIDVRVIAATNKDLKVMIETKKFREDLYYRLNVIPLTIKPLRERREDIEELTNFFIKRYNRLLNKSYNYIKKSTMELLKNHMWRGNVRELENTVEFMINMMESDGVLNDKTLPVDFFEDLSTEVVTSNNANIITPLKELELREIQKALNIFGDTTEGKRKAAMSLGISLTTFYRRLEEVLKK